MISMICAPKKYLTIRKGKAYNIPRKGWGRMEEMTNKQLQFITWLITTATDKCQTIEEVRELNREIRRHSDGLLEEELKEQQKE